MAGAIFGGILSLAERLISRRTHDAGAEFAGTLEMCVHIVDVRDDVLVTPGRTAIEIV